MSIEKFASDIQAYGFGMRLLAKFGGTEILIVPKMTPIFEVIKGKSLREFLQDVISDIKPKTLIAEVGRRNGTAFVGIKDFTYEVQPSDLPAAATKAETVVDPMKEMENLGTLTNSGSSNPMISMYTFQLQQANQNLQRIQTQRDAFETKYESIKEKYNDLKRDYDTIEQKYSLERERDRVASENTLSGTIKELRPEINMAISLMGDKMGVKKQELAGPETKNEAPSISSVIMATLAAMDEAQRTYSFELFIRAFNLTAEDATELMEKLREKNDPLLTAQIAKELEPLIRK